MAAWRRWIPVAVLLSGLAAFGYQQLRPRRADDAPVGPRAAARAPEPPPSGRPTPEPVRATTCRGSIDLPAANAAGLDEARTKADACVRAGCVPRQLARTVGDAAGACLPVVRFRLHGVRERVLRMRVPMPEQSVFHCLYYPCSHNTTLKGWYDCLQETDLRRPAHSPDATRACVAAAERETPDMRPLGDLRSWALSLPSQRSDNPNPMSKKLSIPQDPAVVLVRDAVVGTTGGVVSLRRRPSRLAFSGTPYAQRSMTIPADDVVAASRDKWLSCLDGECEDGRQAHDRVLVASQPQGSATYHFLVEVLPRIAPFLGVVTADTDMKVHCHNTAPIVVAFMTSLGVLSSQLIGGVELGKEVWVPAPGLAHDPFQALWSMHLLSKWLRPAADFFVLPPGTPPSCRARTPTPLRVLVIQRMKNRFIDFREEIYQMVASRIRGDYGESVSVVMLSDRDRPPVLEQVSMWNEADAAVGLHGAGMSLMMFGRHGCLDVVCWRTGAASDIFEHIAIAFGHRFHHVLWRRSVPFLLADVSETMAAVLGHHRRRPLGRRIKSPRVAKFVEVAPTTPAPGGSELRVALLAVYVGRGPSPGFVAALDGVGRNRAVLDMLVVMDEGSAADDLRDTVRRGGYVNVKVITEPSLQEFIHRTASQLVPGLPVLEHDLGWNLCDYRPLYGSIFDKHLAGYTHWGWADGHAYIADLLRHTNGGRDLRDNDVVTFKEPGSWSLFTSGTLSVFKNTVVGREAWRSANMSVVRRTLADPQNNQNDEYLISNAILLDSPATVLVHFRLHRDSANAAIVASPGEAWRIYVAVPRHDTLRLSVWYNNSVCCATPTRVPRSEVKVRWLNGVLQAHHHGERSGSSPGARMSRGSGGGVAWTLPSSI
eukprot:TRINITY_DN13986_c0_g1_i3.p1 TRINITY_DN13986_c0_g1~~TRINITY_DN13986_c0_g1_i3.p1  ORF type:complete len:902 (+),score=236.32 TRINITY_DN13986_c0_g1_i3:66-2708(+)